MQIYAISHLFQKPENGSAYTSQIIQWVGILPTVFFPVLITAPQQEDYDLDYYSSTTTSELLVLSSSSELLAS